jgi:hypothetical protein
MRGLKQEKERMAEAVLRRQRLQQMEQKRRQQQEAERQQQKEKKNHELVERYQKAMRISQERFEKAKEKEMDMLRKQQEIELKKKQFLEEKRRNSCRFQLMGTIVREKQKKEDQKRQKSKEEDIFSRHSKQVMPEYRVTKLVSHFNSASISKLDKKFRKRVIKQHKLHSINAEKVKNEKQRAAEMRKMEKQQRWEIFEQRKNMLAEKERLRVEELKNKLSEGKEKIDYIISMN